MSDKKIYEDRFLEYYFRAMYLLFWPIIWFKWRVLSQPFLEKTFVILYVVFSLLYLILFIIYKKRSHFQINTIDIYYNVFSIITFIITLFSFVIFPKILTVLLIKFVVTGIYFYISTIKTIKYKQQEGVVGIMASLLLFVIAIYY
jgi:hypothetical protein